MLQIYDELDVLDADIGVAEVESGPCWGVYLEALRDGEGLLSPIPIHSDQVSEVLLGGD
jgi:hypothetical protein